MALSCCTAQAAPLRAALNRVGPSASTGARMVSARAGNQINPSIKKDVEKVVDTLKAEELPKKAVFCRCWRSGKFPMCDGAHAKHNAETGDNVGPLIVEK